MCSYPKSLQCPAPGSEKASDLARARLYVSEKPRAETGQDCVGNRNKSSEDGSEDKVSRKKATPIVLSENNPFQQIELE